MADNFDHPREDIEVSQDVITRGEWGARNAKRRQVLRDTTSPTLHYNGPPTGLDEFSDKEEEIKFLKGVQRYHMDTKGWADIAYNFLFAPSGRVYEGRGWKIRSAANGTNKGNSASHAFFLMVGTDPKTGKSEDIPQAMIDSVRRMRALGDSKFVKMHRDWKSTACPGEEIARLVRADVFEGLPEASKAIEPEAPNDVPVEPVVIREVVKPDLSALRLQLKRLEESLKVPPAILGDVRGAIVDIENFT